jgi:hypothetical protein
LSSAAQILARRDAAAARGFTHLRRGLVEDANFDWAAPAPDVVRHWGYALSFADDQRRAVVLIDLEGGWVAEASEASHQASVAPIATGLRIFLEEQFPSP